MTRERKHFIIVGVLAVLAGAAWGCAWYLVGVVETARDAKIAAIEAAQKTAQARASSALLHSAAQESALARTRLDTFTHTDVVSMASIIEAVGKPVGAVIHVTGVGPTTDRDSKLAAFTGVHAVAYSVEAQGSFRQLMAALEVLENLPAPSSIEQFTIARGGDKQAPGAKATEGAWHLTMRIRMLTTVSAS